MASEAVEKAFGAMDDAIAIIRAAVAGPHFGPASGTDPLASVADGCLDILALSARVEARIAALKAEATATYAESARSAAPLDVPVQAQEMAIAAEVGCVLAIGDRAAATLLEQSHALTTFLPLTLAALQEGTVSWQHAKVIVDETATLDRDAAGALEAQFLDAGALNPVRGCPAGEMPAFRFRRKARTWRERHHPDSIEKRHAKGAQDRCLEYTPEQDGMARVSAYLPADQAAAIWNRITAIARGLQGPHEDRTLTQLRVDILATAALRSEVGCTRCSSGSTGSSAAADGPADIPTPRAEVLVSVPVFSLLGLTEEPAMLDGFGPIPASMARNLVANGADSFHRVLVDPRDGAPLEIGRTSYRLTKAMRNWLRMRDGKCPFPGCSNHSLDNEADHLLAWHHGGTTGIANLGQPCPRHHRLKHASGWTPTPATKNEPPGWVSPSGRKYKSEHQDWEPPQWPSSLAPIAGQWQPQRPCTPMPTALGGTVDYLRIPPSAGEEFLRAYLDAK
ncbi:HNH endonuclease signature motif containing protein [Arthrobacter sp. FW306-07-I]|uniref:HNH endonuclease signature motif containing protein n=1 Tax=Arthrobacter sp. FW306-07-I TaxID=2879622 RepID=UPI001F46BD15|nr:HNH endonuclease signature motif containing protein [Arthrobacter sp. FW306-07-I]UKA73812.1 HNH endonuclease [Arthrobacter sp. FW306-07-I]